MVTFGEHLERHNENEEIDFDEQEYIELLEQYIDSIENELEMYYEEPLNERTKRVRIDPRERRERQRDYKKNRQKIKRDAKKRRKTQAYKKWKKKYDKKTNRSSYVKKNYV